MSLETMTKLATVTVGVGGSASITFSNIPQGYTDLKILSSYRTGNAQTYDQLRLTFNGSSTGVYSFIGITGNGSGTPGSEISSSTTSIKVAPGVGNGSTASVFSNDEIYIANYTSNNYKSLLSEGTSEINATAGWISMFVGLWSNPSPITSITLTPESSGAFSQHSTFVLYGIKNARQTVGNSIKATGGSISFDGTYVVHTFNTTDNFTPTQPILVDYLVVAGGGGGGGSQGAGGGAGGLRCTVGATGGGGTVESRLSLTAQAYTVTVGAGGNGGSNGGSNGSNSVFSTITSTGGGGGGYYDGFAGNSGGSGGGGGNAENGTPGAGGSASPSGQGYAGGSGFNRGGSGTYGTAGGGGGAGAVGQAGARSTSSANGGTGVATSISGSSVTYAGGGGGWISNVPYTGAGIGGSGGGGNGGNTSGATSGTANTGGGGGGVNTIAGASGGSGIVIVRYKA